MNFSQSKLSLDMLNGSKEFIFDTFSERTPVAMCKEREKGNRKNDKIDLSKISVLLNAISGNKTSADSSQTAE
jgi:hypothetical protein